MGGVPIAIAVLTEEMKLKVGILACNEERQRLTRFQEPRMYCCSKLVTSMLKLTLNAQWITVVTSRVIW